MSFIGIDNLETFYKEYKRSKIIRRGWAIVNELNYNKYKNIKLTSAEYHLHNSKYANKYEVVDSKQIIIYAESKDKFIIIKYNANFIAVNITDTEYGTILDPMILMAIIKTKDLEQNKEIPTFKDVLHILNWKITRKALNNIKYNNNYF